MGLTRFKRCLAFVWNWKENHQKLSQFLWNLYFCIRKFIRWRNCLLFWMHFSKTKLIYSAVVNVHIGCVHICHSLTFLLIMWLTQNYQSIKDRRQRTVKAKQSPLIRNTCINSNIYRAESLNSLWYLPEND